MTVRSRTKLFQGLHGRQPHRVWTLVALLASMAMGPLAAGQAGAAGFPGRHNPGGQAEQERAVTDLVPAAPYLTTFRSREDKIEMDGISDKASDLIAILESSPYFARATATQVAAELQGAVSSMAAEAGLNVLRSQIPKEEEAEASKRIGVRLTLGGELAGVAKLIAAIEGGQKDLLVSHLEINRKLGSTRRPPTSTVKTAEPTPRAPLNLSVEVRTFMRQGT